MDAQNMAGANGYRTAALHTDRILIDWRPALEFALPLIRTHLTVARHRHVGRVRLIRVDSRDCSSDFEAGSPRSLKEVL
jgi:hypothetical protein